MPLAPSTMFLSSRFVWGLLFTMMSTVFMIYQVEIAGLNPLQLVLVGTALEVGAFLFEVPTGVVADRYSRKLSVVLGFAITGISFILGALFPVFEVLVISAFILGLGWTFISGAHEAWLADEVGEMEAGKLYLRGQRLVSYGAFLGIFTAMLLGSVAIHYPYLLAGVLFLAWAGFAYIGMVETRPPSGSLDEATGALQILKNGIGTIRRSPTLLLLILVGIVIGAYSEGYDRLSTAHLLRNFSFPAPFGVEPVVVFGCMAAIANLLGILFINLVESKVDTENASRVAQALAMVTAGIALATLGFALSGHVWLSILLFILLHPFRAITDPLTTAWINQHVGSQSRATVLSMHSQADAVGQMAGGPGVGLIGRELGIRTAIATASLLITPAIWLYLRARRLA